MAELLVDSDGSVIHVLPDGAEWGRLERRQFPIVAVPLSVEDARKRFQPVTGIRPKLDLSLIPDKCREAVRRNCAALAAVAGEAQDAAKAFVIAEVESTFGTVPARLLGMTTAQLLDHFEKGALAAKDGGLLFAEQIATGVRHALIDASHVGRCHVEDPVLEKIGVPEIVKIDAAALAKDAAK